MYSISESEKNIQADECSKNATYCGNGTCVNTIYGRQCNCKDGFENQNQILELPCQDINECVNIDCGYGTCYNTIGSFVCECDEGYSNLFNSSVSKCGKYLIHHKFSGYFCRKKWLINIGRRKHGKSCRISRSIKFWILTKHP